MCVGSYGLRYYWAKGVCWDFIGIRGKAMLVSPLPGLWNYLVYEGARDVCWK